MIYFFLVLFHFFRLRRFGDPTGADGYFYLKQIQSLSSGEGFYYKDHSLAFALPVALNVFLHDPLLSYQIATCTVLAGLAWAIERLALASAKASGAVVSLPARLTLMAVVSVWLLAQPLALELSVVYLKTAMGLMFLFFALSLWLETRRKSSVAFLVCAALSHKLMVVFVVISLAAWAIARVRKVPSPKRVGVLALVLVSGGVISSLVHPSLAKHLSHILSSLDLSKFDLLTIEESPAEAAGLAVGFLGVCFSIPMLRRFRGDARTVAFAVAALLLVVALCPAPLHSNSLGYRLALIAAPLSAALAALIWSQRKWGRMLALGIMAILVSSGWLSPRSLEKWTIPWSTRVTNVEELAAKLPANALVYAPHGLEFYLAYKTPFRPRSLRVDAGERPVFRVAYVKPYLREGSMLRDEFEQMARLRLGQEFYVFAEDEWFLLERIHLFRPHPMNHIADKLAFVADY